MVDGLKKNRQGMQIRLRRGRPLKVFGWWTGGTLAAALVIFLRQPPTARNVLWAEDGGIFLQQALQQGGVNLLAPYDGYLHLIPRLAAAITVLFTKPAAYALTMNILSCLAVALVAGMVFHCVKQLDERLHVRLAFASIVVLVGSGPLETTGNFANFHWYLLFLTPWLLLKRAESISEAVVLFLVGAVTSFTEILAAMFFPLAILRWKDKALWPARLGVAIGLIGQVITTLTSPRSENTAEALSVGSVVVGWFVNGSGSALYGTGPQLGSVVVNHGWAPLTIAAIPFLAAFSFVLWKGLPTHRLMACIFLGGSVVLWIAVQVINPAPVFDYASFTDDAWEHLKPSRYAVITTMLILALVPLVLAVLPRSKSTIAAGVTAALITLQLVSFFPETTARAGGPDWGVAIEEAFEACQLLSPKSRIELPIAPVGWPAGQVSLPCEFIVAD